jgi:hypothetical protein
VPSEVPGFPLAEELSASRLVDEMGLVGLARIENLGFSRNGRSIDLISVGDGPRAALIVGAPHPNEPTGCLTIRRLLARIAEEGGLRDAPDWQWHFIPAIDIDGLALNEEWFGGPLELERYLSGFYRPPFRLQPEYSFPLLLPGYRFNAQTPENACWRKALESVRPDLQCALHGADTGGAFFILSDRSPALAERLSSIPPHFGLRLNEIGEPFADMKPHRPGVLAFPAFTEAMTRAHARGTRPDSVWDAGDSSAGYAAKRFGTLSMTCEVPLWHDARERSDAPSGRTLGEVIADRVQQLRQDQQLLAAAMPALPGTGDSFETQALVVSLEDFLRTADRSIAALQEARSVNHADRILSQADLVLMEPGTAGLRTVAMLARLARITGEREILAEASRRLDGRLTELYRATRLTPAPLERATELQIAAIVESARSLSGLTPAA